VRILLKTKSRLARKYQVPREEMRSRIDEALETVRLTGYEKNIQIDCREPETAPGDCGCIGCGQSNDFR